MSEHTRLHTGDDLVRRAFSRGEALPDSGFTTDPSTPLFTDTLAEIERRATRAPSGRSSASDLFSRARSRSPRHLARTLRERAQRWR